MIRVAPLTPGYSTNVNSLHSTAYCSKSLGFGAEHLVLILILPLTSRVSLGKLLILSVPLLFLVVS